MLHGDRRVLSVSNQLSGSAGPTAQSFEDFQVIWTRAHNPRRWAFQERRNESERLIKSRRRAKDSWIGHDTNESGQDQDGKGEWFGPRRQAGDPARVLGVVGRRVLDVRIYQDIDVGQQQLKSPRLSRESGLVFPGIQRPRPVQINSGTGTNATHGYQVEWRRLRRVVALQRVVQRLGNKSAHAHVAGCRRTTHLPSQLIIERDCRSHDALA